MIVNREYYLSVDMVKYSKKLKEVLEDDLKFIDRVVLPVTSKRILNLSHECARKLIRDFVKTELRQYLQRGVIFPILNFRLSNVISI
jgi:hypothetical protein